MEREFIELPGFTRLVKSGHLDDAMISQLQVDIMQGLGKTLEGTGGLQKIRLARPGSGKSGGWRVVYVDYPGQKVTVLINAFPKNTKANLSHEEKNVLKDLKPALDRAIEVMYGKGQ